MSDVQLYLLEVDKNTSEATRIAAEAANKLADGRVKIVELVETLGEYLNSEDAAVRPKAVAFLSDVLAVLPQRTLSRQQRELLNDFTLSRVENGAEGLGSCARALVALEKMGKFDEQRVEKITRVFLQNASPLAQFKTQSERFSVLMLFDVLIEKYRLVLERLHKESPDFLSSFVCFLEGEKDPRNLMIVFSVLNVVMVEWDVSTYTSELFTAVFDYFPITFRPPPNDPFAITAQQLKDRLRECISATSGFAPQAFPALLDKLDSSSINVKRDSLQAIRSCSARYGAATMHLYSVNLWDALKYEILNAEEEDLAEEALLCLREIALTLSQSSHEEHLQTYIRPIAKECNQHLEDTPTKQSEAAGRILKAVGSASPEASSLIIKGVVPTILELYGRADNIPRRRGLLEILTKMIDANLETYGRWRTLTGDETFIAESKEYSRKLKMPPNALLEQAEQCLQIYNSGLMHMPISEVSFRLLSMNGLRQLIMICRLLNDSTITSFVKILDTIVISEESYGRDEVKAAAIDTLVDIAHQKPQLVIEQSIPDFMAQLPDDDRGWVKLYVPTVEAVAKLTLEPQIFGTVILRLKNKLYAALRHDATPKYCSALLSALCWAFDNSKTGLDDPAFFGKYYQELVLPLLKDCIARAEPIFAKAAALNDFVVVNGIGRLCNTVLRTQPWVAQTEVCRNVYTMFRPLEITDVPPFHTSPGDTCIQLVASTYILAALQREARPHTEIDELYRHVITFSQQKELSPHIRQAAIDQAALIANKYLPAGSRESNSLPHLTNEVISNGDSTLVCTAFRILKALVLRTDPSISGILPRFLALLSHPTLGNQAAFEFGRLLEPDSLLTQDNHCRVSGLHKQRFFSLTVPFLTDSFRSQQAQEVAESHGIRRNILTALSGILNHIPYDLLLDELPRLITLLLQSLTLDEVHVKNAAMATFSKIIVEDPKLLQEHIGSLVTRLLAIGVCTKTLGSTQRPTLAKSVARGEDPPRSQSPPKTRLAALACLNSFVGSFRTDQLLTFRRQVVRSLVDALDDRKRAVRAEAVRCRRSWIDLGSSEDDDDE